MKYLLNPSVNPYFNLALDEYALKQLVEPEDFFFLWQNQPSVIIGKNQTTLNEINPKFIQEHDILVARRISGGGAVYHDFGNLNFTFIINVADPGHVNYKKYVTPIVAALNHLGVPAEASGRNDILVNGLKVSGNAQRYANGKLMHHGTIMFDVDINNLVEALSVDPHKIIAKGVASVRSRVTNIKEHLTRPMEITDFWQELQYYLSNQGNDQEIILSDQQLTEIHQLAKLKFSTWDFIYGESPAFDYRNQKRFTGGQVETLVKVEQGKIVYLRFLGDYLGLKDISELETRLVGLNFEKQSLTNYLSQINLRDYFGQVSLEELLEVLFG